MSDTAQRVYRLVRLIPAGRVTSYGTLAKAAGIANPRLVGTILHRNDDPAHVPCHRVVRSDGTLASGYAFGGPLVQAKQLEAEGITIKDNRIDLADYFWQP